MMKAPLKLMLFIIMLFCFTAVGIEIYRFVSFQLELEQALKTMMRDAIDLHLDDTYRTSHVSYIRPEEISNTRAFVKQMIRDRYGLDPNMCQNPEKDFKGALEIPDSDFVIQGGSFITREVSAEGFSFIEPLQGNTPAGQIRVILDYKPMIFRMGDALSTDVLKMDIYVEVEHQHF